MSVTQLLSAPVGFRKRLYFSESRGPDGAAILEAGGHSSVWRQRGCPHRAALGYRVSEVAHLDYPRKKERNNPTLKKKTWFTVLCQEIALFRGSSKDCRSNGFF